MKKIDLVGAIKRLYFNHRASKRERIHVFRQTLVTANKAGYRFPRRTKWTVRNGKPVLAEIESILH